MAYQNYLLFNNTFLKKISPNTEDLGSSWRYIRTTAREYFHRANFTSPACMAETLIRPLLQVQSLDLVRAGLVEEGEFLLVAPWDSLNPLGVLWIAPHGENLDGRDENGRIPKGHHWMIKAVEAARRNNLRWTILTNGEQWRLLDATGLRRYEAFLEIDLGVLVKAKEQNQEFDLAAYLFNTLFQYEKGLATNPENGHCGLDEFYNQSLHATEKTERYLRQTVSDSLDTPGGGDGIMAQLCLGLVWGIDPSATKVFAEDERTQIYLDSTYLLYRLLFILYAEARGLLPATNPDYKSVSLERLIDEAEAFHENADLAAEHPTHLWDNLITLFNFVDIGDHPLEIAPFDGGLFDDSERPYLSHYKIENTYLAAALCHLAFEIDPKNPQKKERIDYRDLSVRHLGSLYEGMIEYRLFIAEEDLLAKREKDGRVRFWAAKTASFGLTGEPIKAGQVYFAQSPHERKGTGTHYTAEELVEKLVHQTVLRMLDERWTVFQNDLDGWLCQMVNSTTKDREAAMRDYIDKRLDEFVQKQVLTLRVCDPAMGSGHFLVHTAHQITNFILQILAKTSWENSEVNLDPEEWRRWVVENCLYGVDINPMAVELAKLSLWLATMQKGRLLSFLDHRLKRGNTLLGVRFNDIVAVLQESELNRDTRKSIITEARGQYTLKEASLVESAAKDAVQILENLVGRDASEISGIEAQKEDYHTAQQRLGAYRSIGDFLVTLKMGLSADNDVIHGIARFLERDIVKPLILEHRLLLDRSKSLVENMNVFHWDLEFPDIFISSKNKNGFDLVIGNPPFLGGFKFRSELGNNLTTFILSSFKPSGGQADLCAYFLRKGYSLLNENGSLGMVTTNTAGQGDTRTVGTKSIIESGGQIIFVEKYVKWEGDANVEVNLICIQKSTSRNERLLDGSPINFISSYLDDLPEGNIVQLCSNKNRGMRGLSVGGEGFVISAEKADELRSINARNSLFIFPYLNGEDLNNKWDDSIQKWIINFGNLDFNNVSMFPELLSILKKTVYPFRQKSPTKREHDCWWQFARSGERIKKSAINLERFLVRSRVSERHMLMFLPSNYVIGDALVVFAFEDYYHFSILQSWIHELWLRRQASTLRTDVRYTPTDCFQTFPFSQSVSTPTVQLAERAGRVYYEHRQQFMFTRQLGLTKTYNLFNNPDCKDPLVQELQELHAAMDLAVLACYGWDDIKPHHDFFINDRKKIRFMPSLPAQREIFSRLMALNQRIAAEEATQGLAPVVNIEDEEELEE